MPITLDGTLGITTPALTVTGATVNTGGISSGGNLTFTTAGSRILADMSGAAADRLAFQSSTVNGNTLVNFIPNGTGTSAQLRVFNSSTPTNCVMGQFVVSTTEVRVASAIDGTGTYLPMTFYTGGSERMRIDTSGNVGIGTASPSTYGKFVVLGASTNRAFYADSLAQPVARYDDNSFVVGGFTLRNTALSGANQGIGILFQLGTGGSAVNSGSIEMRSEGDYATVAAQDSSMAFSTAINGGATEKMRISSAGNVLIGSSSDNGYKLKVIGGNANSLLLDNDGSQYTQLLLQRNATTNTGGDILIDGSASTMNIRGLLAGPMIFQTSASAGSPVERMRIASDGSVGIGSSTPAVKLQVTNTSAESFAVRYQQTTAANALMGFQTSTDSNAYSVGCGSAGSNAFVAYSGGLERMRIDSSGRVTTPYQPAFFVYPSTSTTATIAAFNTAVFNIGSYFNTSTYTFTAPVAGVYWFNLIIAWDGTGTAPTLVSLYKNGGRERDMMEGNYWITNSEYHASTILYLNTNDQIYVHNNGNANLQGGASSAQYYSSFQGYLVG